MIMRNKIFDVRHPFPFTNQFFISFHLLFSVCECVCNEFELRMDMFVYIQVNYHHLTRYIPFVNKFLNGDFSNAVFSYSSCSFVFCFFSSNILNAAAVSNCLPFSVFFNFVSFH